MMDILDLIPCADLEHSDPLELYCGRQQEGHNLTDMPRKAALLNSYKLSSKETHGQP
jgi:hypothetical protein